MYRNLLTKESLEKIILRDQDLLFDKTKLLCDDRDFLFLDEEIKYFIIVACNKLDLLYNCKVEDLHKYTLSNGFDLLAVACIYGNIESVEYLISPICGFDIHNTIYGDSYLMISCIRDNNFKMFEYLKQFKLPYEGNMDNYFLNNDDVGNICCMYNSANNLKYFIDKELIVIKENYIQHSIEHGSLQCLKYLLIDCKYHKKYYLQECKYLCKFSLLKNQIKIFQFILNIYSFISFKSFINDSKMNSKLLFDLARENAYVSLRYLHENNINLCTKDTHGRLNIACVACLKDNIETVKFLHSIGVDFNYEISGITPLFIAFSNNCEKVFKYGCKENFLITPEYIDILKTNKKYSAIYFKYCILYKFKEELIAKACHPSRPCQLLELDYEFSDSDSGFLQDDESYYEKDFCFFPKE
jgi:hypothetical protein